MHNTFIFKFFVKFFLKRFFFTWSYHMWIILNRSIWSRDEVLTGTTPLGQNELGSNGNEEGGTAHSLDLSNWSLIVIPRTSFLAKGVLILLCKWYSQHILKRTNRALILYAVIFHWHNILLKEKSYQALLGVPNKLLIFLLKYFKLYLSVFTIWKWLYFQGFWVTRICQRHEQYDFSSWPCNLMFSLNFYSLVWRVKTFLVFHQETINHK